MTWRRWSTTITRGATRWPIPTSAGFGPGHGRRLDRCARADQNAPDILCGTDAVRKVDIAHSGQTVVEAMERLRVEVKKARRDREIVLLVVHGFGASGVGGAIKAALSTELPGLAGRYGFKAYGYAGESRIPR